MKKVVKFGGSSLANAEQFRKVGEIVRAESSRVYAIPSAPGKRFPGDVKVTDLLYSLYDAAAAGKDFSDILAQIRVRYQEIIDGLSLKAPEDENRPFSLEPEFEKIEEALRTRPERDYAASRGEYLNGILMAAYLDYEFIDAQEVIFFGEDGTLDAEKTNQMLRERLGRTERAVIPGFFGCGADGRVRTFSRGGSDITGSLVARAAKADVYENWTDVSGFMVADPRIVSDPQSIDTITYRELRELSYMGASVLHEEAIFPVRSEGIPINIRNTNRPEDEGTWIVESTCQKSQYVITGIAGKKDFCSVIVSKALMNSEIGFCRKVLQAFEENGMSIEHMPSGIDTMTVVVHESEFMDREQRVVSAIHRGVKPDSIEIDSDLALIAVVGRGMKSMRGTAGRIFSALAHAHVNVRMIDQGSSELNIIVGVENHDFETAIRAIYDIFVTTQI
ncbi:aspartate kinase [Lachnoclostridium sp. Marseille-P6806]|uniref:aspartate kinase n=1 Tax=Lachnoclostridium sp. Marseille-P6806 TaxID=2364793 RepID=UPI0010301436|nr:aspartate kinase [Lachnoclostridium sp. Marseille-P6806]